MGKIKTVELTGAQRAALEKGYRDSESHDFRVRCHQTHGQVRARAPATPTSKVIQVADSSAKVMSGQTHCVLTTHLTYYNISRVPCRISFSIAVRSVTRRPFQ